MNIPKHRLYVTPFLSETLEHVQWRRVAIIVDRLFLYTFSLFTVACNIYFAVHILLGSDENYDKELAEFEAEMVD